MYKKNTQCRICKSNDLRRFLVLGNQPFANSFLKKEELDKEETKVPLEAYWCENCNLAQLIDVVDKEILFKNYIYFSSGVIKLSNHFKEYAENVIERFLSPGDFVAEIASNDGILLKFFKDRGYKVQGIDPAENIVSIADGLGVPTKSNFFSEDIAREIVAESGNAKLIMGNNVVAHIDDHHELVRGLDILLDEDGVFVLEAPYLLDMFENLAYDTIYHEHLSFLAIRPLKILFERFGLEIFDVELHAVQGQSIRVFVGRKGRHEINSNVKDFIDRELELGFDKFESYVDLANRVEKSKNEFMDLIKKLKVEGKKIAAYGASAKGNTLLNYCQCDDKYIDYILDDMPSKQGLYTPGTHIEVVDRQYTLDNPPDYFVLLAWNYAKNILEREKEYRDKGGKFIMPIGDNINIL